MKNIYLSLARKCALVTTTFLLTWDTPREIEYNQTRVANVLSHDISSHRLWYRQEIPSKTVFDPEGINFPHREPLEDNPFTETWESIDVPEVREYPRPNNVPEDFKNQYSVIKWLINNSDIEFKFKIDYIGDKLLKPIQQQIDSYLDVTKEFADFNDRTSPQHERMQEYYDLMRKISQVNERLLQEINGAQDGEIFRASVEDMYQLWLILYDFWNNLWEDPRERARVRELYDSLKED